MRWIWSSTFTLMHHTYQSHKPRAELQDISFLATSRKTKTHYNQWEYLQCMCNTQICCVLSSRGRIRRTIHQCKGMKNCLPCFTRTRPPTASHTHPLWQQDSSRHSKQHGKKHRLRSMEMQFFWITDQVKRSHYDVKWHPGQENLADYFTKVFTGKHHLAVCPWYLHEENSPRSLPRAAAPATLRGCVGTL